MLDILHAPILDKQRLIGGCVRLKVTIDAVALRREVDDLPASMWGSTGGRVGVHSNAEALFLRGYAPAEGDKPVDDRAALDLLPYARSVIETLLPGIRLRCLLARLPAGGTIAAHIDRAPYFSKTLRVHVPVETNPEVRMVAAGLAYTMRAGEVWVLNNSAMHGVSSACGQRSRTHLICDFLPSPALLDLLAAGDRDLGRAPTTGDTQPAGHPLSGLAAAG